MRSVLVIPCFNESARFRRDEVGGLLAAGVDVVLVDDGSRDGTLGVLRDVAAEHVDRIEVLALPENCGKAEAVRQGLLRALSRGAEAVGYADADFSTPGGELVRLFAIRREAGALAATGLRLARLGADVRRSTLRHYLGRVFATIAAQVIGAQVYDTQCGAKVFEAGEELRESLERPFVSRWAFDVELLGRLMNCRERRGRPRTDGIVEVPLERWHDRGGSKLGPASMIRATFDLVRIGRALREDRRRRRGT